MLEQISFNTIFIISLAATWLLLFYHVVLAHAGYRYFVKQLSENQSEPLKSYPMVTVLVPAHNEQMVIGNTVDALARLDYPKDKIEIIVINDSSTDRTGEILSEKERQYPWVKVLTIKPPLGGKGKSTALNQGLQASTGEFIVVYDADNTPERSAVRLLVEAIVQDPQLGAVVGKFRTRNRDTNLLTRFINIETLSFQWSVQAGRCQLFGLTTISGTNFIVRRKVLDQLGGWNTKALTEDTELSIRIYELGYRIKWLPDSVTWEQEPEKIGVWLRQRTRWARGNMWVIGHYLKRIFFLRNRRIAGDIIYFFFTYAIFFFAVILSDIIFLLGLFGKVHLDVSGPLGVIWFLAYVLFILETFISLSMERGEGNLKNLLLTAIMYFTYCQLWIYLVFRASWVTLIDKITGASFHWYKTERSSR